MIKLIENGVFVVNGRAFETDIDKLEKTYGPLPSVEEAKKGTITYKILDRHNIDGNESLLKIKFDALASHDITYVNVIQTAKASGLDKFPLPYVLTNCHNSLCAVGGTINEDDHKFGLSAAQKYGGIYVPPHMAVIHQVMRELYAGCGKMILGTDSHTRYGALGTLGIGEGGGEMVKQIVSRTYDIPAPQVVCVYVSGKLQDGVGPQDVALALIGATFTNGFVKNKILEFIGDGVEGLSMDFRNGIDVMTTETSCLSSVWETDDRTSEYLKKHNRADDFETLSPDKFAYYDSMIFIDLGKIRPMIALPFHPSNVYAIEDLNSNLFDILRKVELDAKDIIGKELNLKSKIVDGKLAVDQGVIAGCAGGTFENIKACADILGNKEIGNGGFGLSVYPASAPVHLKLAKDNTISDLMRAGAVIHTAFCGPCFGAGDVPANDELSIRHTTRNFPYREGSRPKDGQIASVALMDARSIAATALNNGFLTHAVAKEKHHEYSFDSMPYKSRIYNGWTKPNDSVELVKGPNIIDWPDIPELGEHMLYRIVSYITDPVTTTDELIPSGETSSYRSNPIALAKFTLSRKDPLYVERANEVSELRKAFESKSIPEELGIVFERIKRLPGFESLDIFDIGIASAIYATKPGDGSAREQAASCQKVLGTSANFALEYATKRYVSNLINWGILPLTINDSSVFNNGDYIFVPNTKSIIEAGQTKVKLYVIKDKIVEIEGNLQEMTPEEIKILSKGCLINYYRTT